MEFSDLALAKLLQTLPELGSLILTFQDLTEEAPPESGVKAGAFVLRSGSEVFFVPVLARGDTLYPIDSVFMQSTGMFSPLSRKTMESIINAGQIEMGKGTKIPKTVNGNPSIQNLVTPPRTGKFIQASTSRMVDFLAGMPEQVKGWVMDKVASERPVLDDLNAMFGIKAIFDALKPIPQSLANKTNEAPISVITEAAPGLSTDTVQSILKDGYAVVGTQPEKRLALSVQSFERNGVATRVSSLDGEHDYDLSMRNGPAREAFLPKMHALHGGQPYLAIFSNSDFATSSNGFVVVGSPLDRKKVLTRAFEFNPPCLLRDAENGDQVALCTNSGTFLGPYRVSRVVHDAQGVCVSVNGGHGYSEIRGLRNFKGEAQVLDKTLYVPYNVIVLHLNQDLSMDLEQSAQAAAYRKEMEALGVLGSELNLGFDGVEYFADGRPLGSEAAAMHRLVVEERLDPAQARTFVKQAQVTKRVKIYMSKAASTDYNPAEVPQTGVTSPDPAENVGLNGSFMNQVQDAVKTRDSQTVEASIMSQLLQVPDMHEQISEYLPEIEAAVDRLGRTLFLCRLNISTLSESQGSEAIFALLAQLKSVYRTLGENLIVLKQVIQSSGTPVTNMEG
jgi:hypothetical protein